LTKVINDAFVKKLEYICYSNYHVPDASTRLCENALKDIKAKWMKELETNVDLGNIETYEKSKERLPHILKEIHQNWIRLQQKLLYAAVVIM